MSYKGIQDTEFILTVISPAITGFSAVTGSFTKPDSILLMTALKKIKSIWLIHWVHIWS